MSHIRNVVYQGARLSAQGRGKLVEVWALLDHDGAVLESCYFQVGKRKRVVGGIYECEVELKNGKLDSLKIGKLVSDGSYSDETLVAEWQARDIADRQSSASFKKEEKLAKEFAEFDECLKPIARAWAKTNAQGKRAIEIRVLESLRKFY